MNITLSIFYMLQALSSFVEEMKIDKRLHFCFTFKLTYVLNALNDADSFLSSSQTPLICFFQICSTPQNSPSYLCDVQTLFCISKNVICTLQLLIHQNICWDEMARPSKNRYTLKYIDLFISNNHLQTNLNVMKS